MGVERIRSFTENGFRLVEIGQMNWGASLRMILNFLSVK